MSDLPLVGRARAEWRRLQEAGWTRPALGAVLGIALAVVFSQVEPDATKSAVTVEQSRDSLWAALALLYTGLSIVLAVVTLTAGNLASRFSPRLLRVKLASFTARLVLFVFSFSFGYILTVLVLERTKTPDDTAAPVALGGALVLLVVSAVALVVYIIRLLQALRVDRTVRWIGSFVLSVARHRERRHRDEVELPASALAPPLAAVEVRAHADGYLGDVGTADLHRLATKHKATIAVEALPGQLAAPGDRLGWLHTTGDDEGLAETVAGLIKLEDAQDTKTDVGYGIELLVDISLTALSPAINDPHTAVQSVDQLTRTVRSLAEFRLGPRGHPGDGDEPIVLVNMPTLGDHVEHAVSRILLYGATDPVITEALLHLVSQLERFGPLDSDRSHAREMTAQITAAAADA